MARLGRFMIAACVVSVLIAWACAPSTTTAEREVAPRIQGLKFLNHIMYREDGARLELCFAVYVTPGTGEVAGITAVPANVCSGGWK